MAPSAAVVHTRPRTAELGSLYTALLLSSRSLFPRHDQEERSAIANQPMLG
jgi:hypothetical protein